MTTRAPIRRGRLPFALLGLIGTIASAEPLVLNEYNAVSGSNFLNGGDEFVDEDGNTAPPFDPFFGRVPGNGGDWFELVVVAEGLDIRGWQLEIFSDGELEPRLVFTDAPLWESLEAGTIITVAEDVPDDPSYDPANGDWWINVNAANPEDGGTGEFISADNFPVNNDDWQLTIYDAEGNVVFGPAGEGIVSDDGVASGIGVNSRETFALQVSPAADVGRDDAGYNDAIASSFGAPNGALDQVAQDFAPLRQDLPWPDRDFDGISEDGNRNGLVGDATCIGGNTIGCDDNCSLIANPAQADTGGVGGALADGIGNACQCGDVNNDGQVLQNDGLRVRLFALGIIPQLPAPTKCDVTGEGACDITDAAVILRAQNGVPPGIAQGCEAAVGPADETELLYAADRVVEIDVTMDPVDFQALRGQTRDLEELVNDPECGMRPWPSPFTWFPADITIDGEQQVNLVGIRKKGFQGSLSEEKPALKLDLNRFIAGGDINGVTRLTLNNARQDPSLAKQCLAFQIFRDAGLVAPRCNFAQVRVNGEELGIYVNVEEVDETFVARNFDDPLGKLFEAEISDFWPGPWINTWDPDTESAEDGNEELLDLTDVLELTPYESLLPELEARVDIPWFVRYWATEALIAHSDGYAFNMNNSVVYVSPLENQMRFIPWDMDSDFFPEGQTIFAIRSALARRMYNLPDTQALFLAEMQTVLDSLWDPNTYLTEIDRIDALLSPRLLALFGQQAVNEMRFFQGSLRTWIANREDDVLAELAAPPVDVRDVQVAHLCDQEVR
ncbi:MAG: CotH kinase family protein [Pseudomonadota bacterium]